MYIGIDLGGTNIAAGLVTDKGEIMAKASVPTNSGRPTEEIVRDMAELSKQLITENDLSIDDIEAVGIGCPGTIDYKTGEVVYCNNIKMDHFPLSDVFRKHLDLPVRVDNDANCAALGEYKINGGGASSYLLITLGTGVGGGLILNGRLHRGFNGVAAEPGHITLVSGGERCTCGKEGCWECYASATALVRDTKRAMEKAPDSLMHKVAANAGKVGGKTAFDAAEMGDSAAKQVVDNYIRYVADGIVSCANFVQPEITAIGGGVSKQGESLIAPIREYVYRYEYNKHMPKMKVEAASLGNDAGIIGAAMLCMEE
ncbi:MAG: ROK family glucokinase [Clostridia bacterium]|nr:ROK family glucokinase [Clostridia bacterium]